MAINHNFKEGIDWATDPTGETPLANHLFVSEDSTSTEDGTPQNPYNTVEAALTAAVSGDRIIIGSGIYNVNVGIFGKTNVGLQGDGYVVFNGNSGTFVKFDANATLGVRNIRMLNYNELIDPTTVNQFSTLYLFKCFSISCNYNQSFAAGQFLCESSIFIDCTIVLPSGATSSGSIVNNSQSKLNISGAGSLGSYNCIFINSRYEHTKGVQNTYFDSDSFVYFTSDTSQASFLSTNFNNIRCAIQIEGVTYATLSDQKTADTRINQNSIDVTPGFNSEINYVFSLSPTSQMISKGKDGSNITGRFVGDGYYRGVTEMDAAVDANANINYNSINEIVIGAGGGTSEVLGEIVKQYDDLTIAGQIDIAGFLDMINMIPDSDNTLVNPNNLILEMAFAGVDEVYTAYKKYRWDEIPTNNTDGTSNGQSTYNWNENNRIICQFIKVRVTILNDGVYNQA